MKQTKRCMSSLKFGRHTFTQLYFHLTSAFSTSRCRKLRMYANVLTTVHMMSDVMRSDKCFTCASGVSRVIQRTCETYQTSDPRVSINSNSKLKAAVPHACTLFQSERHLRLGLRGTKGVPRKGVGASVNMRV